MCGRGDGTPVAFLNPEQAVTDQNPDERGRGGIALPAGTSEGPATPERRPGRPFASGVEPDWEAIREDYEASALPMKELLDRHNVCQTTFYNKREKEGWPMRKPSSVSERSAIIARLFRVLDAHVIQMETEMTKDNAAAGEKEARVLSNLSRTLDKLIDIDNAERKTRSQKARRGRDIEQLRHELAIRIVKLSKR